MTPTEASIHRLLSEIWLIRKEKQEAAREKAILDGLREDRRREQWRQYQTDPIISDNHARYIETTEIQ
ncbi:MAG: hypothetical protein LC793_23670 [Thermomicrobia bacterium]|nr:hypothetical protein [Thermomicrobia bacterium]